MQLKLIGCSLSFFLSVFLCKAQNNIDTSSIDKSLIELYKDSLKQNLRLYNGSEYVRYGHGFIGFPFFEADDYVPGSIYYDGVLYKNIPIMYDLVEDEIIIKDYNKNYEIRLVKDKIEAFSLSSHNFIAVHSDTIQGNIPSLDFYEVLYKGSNNTLVLVKHQKTQELSNKADEPSKFNTYDHYYLHTGNDFMVVNNARDVYEAFADKKADIKKFLKKNNLKLKKNMGNALIEIAKYYDSLK